MSDISRLVAAWVSAQQRHYHSSTRGIATVEQRIEWEREAEAIIAAHDREVAARVLREFADRQDSWCKAGREDQIISRIAMRDALNARADQIEDDA